MNKIIKTSLLLLALGSTSISWSQSRLDKAEQLIDKGQYTEALVNINQMIGQNPNDAKLYLRLADVQMKMGKIDLACATYSMMESMNMNTDDQFYLSYGIALKMLAKYDEAIQKFNKCKGPAKAQAQKQIQSCVFAKEIIRNEDVKKVMNLDMNTSYKEYGSLVMDNLMIFNSDKLPFMTDNTKSLLKDEPNHVYMCKSLHNGSTSSLLVEGENNNIKIEAVSITDNNMVAFTTINDPSNILENHMSSAKIQLAEYNGFQFENIKEFEHNGTFSNYSPCLANDGNTIYFTSNRPGGFGGFDLYVSNIENGKWSDPVNLGEDVNTDGNEITPFYSNSMLWFASDNHEGLGGYDIFSAQNIGDGFINVQNMGLGINSESNDFFPNVKNLVMYFTSDRTGGKGEEDIYRAPLSERHYTIDLIDGSYTHMPDAVALNEETPPPAVSLESFKVTSQSNIDEMLSGARRVSLSEMVENKTKPKVYFIQLASMSNDASNTNKYKSLIRYGNIYKVRVNNTFKVRLGYFLERGETSTLLGKVRNSGFKDAFIVEQELNTSDLELMLSQTDYSTTNSASSSTPKHKSETNNPGNISNNFEYTKPLPPASAKEYKVRLGAFEDPIWFDSKNVKDLGKLEQWTKGAWTIFILGGFNSFEEAEKARIMAINRGYADSEVVIDNGGIIERIKKN